MELRKISILGCGWLGKPLGQELVKRGHSVSGSTTTESKLTELQSAGIKPYLISFDPSLKTSGNDSFFDSEVLIISIPPKRKAGETGLYYSQMKEVVKEAIKGKIKKVLFISSTSVYPDLNKEMTEEDPTFDEEKNILVKAEKLFLSQKEFVTTVIRFGGLIGGSRHPGRFFAGKVDVLDGNCPVNLIHLQDCIAILSKIIETDTFGEIFNACSDLHPLKKDFYTSASATLSLIPPVFLNEEEGSFKSISSEKLKQKLNYRFIYSDPFSMI
ncbi:MAG TPA: NAD(P)-binding domain-containing protein [Cytophagales bacterium]|nr:NAD(P)-binding domain-containing protein [Cytophagales bacterium]